MELQSRHYAAFEFLVELPGGLNRKGNKGAGGASSPHNKLLRRFSPKMAETINEFFVSQKVEKKSVGAKQTMVSLGRADNYECGSPTPFDAI